MPTRGIYNGIMHDLIRTVGRTAVRAMVMVVVRVAIKVAIKLCAPQNLPFFCRAIYVNGSIAFMSETYFKSGKLLLHACCGPCSLEPVRLLCERGVKPSIYYANSNIEPAEEYARRLDAIMDWAQSEDLLFIEGTYAPEVWEEHVGVIGPAEDLIHAEESGRRKARCRACYRLRFEETAQFAAENGFDAVGTTLTISPYQYTNTIREELESACKKYGVSAAFEDYSPHYREATRRSREMGMYRQNFCGCRFSEDEAAAQRAYRKAKRKAGEDTSA